MKKNLMVVGLAAVCAGVVIDVHAQDNMSVSEDCSSATVNGVQGEFWQVTENGQAKWVILDSNENYLADAPARCSEALTAMLAGDSSSATPPAPPSMPAPEARAPAAPAPSAPGSAVPAPVGASGLSPAQQEEILARHNHWREAVGAPALTWSPEMAAFAQQWAEALDGQGCDMRHRPKTGPYAQRYGENLYSASPVIWSDGRTEVQLVAPGAVVDSWDSEKIDYDYASNSCAGGKVCGHYTQLVWAGSARLGCGMKVCGDKSQVWVCNYDPAGNVGGERPY
jgi:pathogenesis-related protein 1